MEWDGSDKHPSGSPKLLLPICSIRLVQIHERVGHMTLSVAPSPGPPIYFVNYCLKSVTLCVQQKIFYTLYTLICIVDTNRLTCFQEAEVTLYCTELTFSIICSRAVNSASTPRKSPDTFSLDLSDSNITSLFDPLLPPLLGQLAL